MPPKAKYDDRGRELTLGGLPKDGMSVERASTSIRREFLLDLSTGFVYGVLRNGTAELDMAARRMVLGRFSGMLCVDEVRLGRVHLAAGHRPASRPAGGLRRGRQERHRSHASVLGNLKTWG